MVKNKIKISKVRVSWPMCHITRKQAHCLPSHLRKSSLKCLQNPESSSIPLNGTETNLL